MAEITNDIMQERIEIGLKMIDDLVNQTNKKLSDYEKMDLALRIGIALFIEKNKAYRTSQIRKKD